jgi:hypothetical protein
MNEMNGQKDFAYDKINDEEVKVLEIKANPEGNWYKAKCIFHDGDSKASLTIYPESGKYHCFGCGKDGMLIKDVFHYEDQDKNLRYVVIKLWTKPGEEKIFVQCQPPLGDGRMLKGLGGMEKILYRLPEVLKSQRVFVVEGEKDVETLRAFGLVATTNTGGANARWKDEYSLCLKGKDVIILPDNDEAGLSHGKDVALSLTGIAKRVRLVNLPGLKDKEDVTNWLEAGNSIQDFAAIIEQTPEVELKDLDLDLTKPLTTCSISGNFLIGDNWKMRLEGQAPNEWLWDGIIPSRGVSMILGKPKLGKSTLALNLADCITKGNPFLGGKSSRAR